MIFLSYTHNNKSLVDQIAQRLAKAFGRENVFFDSWSIQPGEGIIDKMNDALECCKYFFFFVSKHSLQSKMVKLEWQNALYKSTKDAINIIPVKVDNCIMPAILMQTLYIDIYGQGLEVAIRQMIDVISGNNTHRSENIFHNIRAYISQCKDVYNIEFRAEMYMEPHSSYIILLENPQEDVSFKAIGENIFDSGFNQIQLDNGIKTNAILIGRNSATSPGFPFIVEIIANNNKEIKIQGAMRIVSRDKYEIIPTLNI